MELKYPTEINHIKVRGVIRITWDDGHVGEYAEAYLRGWCPCAMCQGHGPGQKFISVENAKLQDIHAVGNYAVEFHWQDGHSTGIYAYDYLRSLCPCPACKGSQESAN
ncbi:MAG: gamma-butyrobetaine hydroxylase-like domain-containing protein [Candidatus Binatia bacterium]